MNYMNETRDTKDAWNAEIETHRYFLLFQEYLDKLEKEQPKGGEKENATRHKAVSSPL